MLRNVNNVVAAILAAAIVIAPTAQNANADAPRAAAVVVDAGVISYLHAKKAYYQLLQLDLQAAANAQGSTNTGSGTAVSITVDVLSIATAFATVREARLAIIRSGAVLKAPFNVIEPIYDRVFGLTDSEANLIRKQIGMALKKGVVDLGTLALRHVPLTAFFAALTSYGVENVRAFVVDKATLNSMLTDTQAAIVQTQRSLDMATL